MKYCHKCGFYLKFEGTIYCPSCGVKLVYNIDEMENKDTPVSNNIPSGSETKPRENVEMKYDIPDAPLPETQANENKPVSNKKPRRAKNNTTPVYNMADPTDINISEPQGYDIIEPTNYNIVEPTSYDVIEPTTVEVLTPQDVEMIVSVPEKNDD